MDKEQEIKLLTSLANEDTYFAQHFKNDVTQMVSNINNDFPLLFNTQWVKFRNQHQRKAVKNAIKAQIAALLKMHKNDPSDELEQTITDLIFFENRL